MATAKKQQNEMMVATINPAEVAERVREMQREVRAIVQRAGTVVVVEDADDYRVACDKLIEIVVKRKRADEWREGFMAKVKELVSYVDATFAEPLEELKEGEGQFRRAIETWALQLDAKAHGLRKAAAHLPARDEDKAVEMLHEAAELVPPKVPGIAITTKAKLEIIDEKRIPEQFWMTVVNTKALEAAMAKGDTVPGVRATLTKTVAVTPSRAKGAV